MEKSTNDVEKFNESVKLIIFQIQERGAKVEDENLMVSLFRAYLSVSDMDFRRYLKNQRDDYNDGKTELSPDNLMELAGNKYKTLVEEDMWQAPTASDKEIIALRAQIASLKSPTNPGKKEKVPDKKKKFEKKKESTSYAWKTVAPKTGDPLKKNVGEKTYHWCIKHSAWTLHPPRAMQQGECTYGNSYSSPFGSTAPIADSSYEHHGGHSRRRRRQPRIGRRPENI
jgi:hypothetical protein